ncbi:hypothetical protein ACFQ45_08970 [Rhodanobacter aciditrophus]|uniref:Polysaccharide biosynthesis protein n=1 Tax=Rhodanobacter aciditrophus TaxID=1623218 RepID=A0ABW4B0P9_9GAMM
MILKYGLLKYLGLGCSVIIGFLLPAVFSRNLSTEDFAMATVVLGLSSYFSFFDFGVGKPAYSKIRKSFLNGDSEWKEDIYSIISFFIFSSFLVFFSFLFITYFYIGKTYPYTNFFLFLFFSFFVSLNIFLNNMESVYNAVNKYFHFLIFDFLRKISPIIIVVLIPVYNQLDVPYFFSTFFLLLLSVFSFFYFVRSDAIKIFHIKKHVRFVKKLWEDAFSYLFFNFSEAFIYNFGFILFPYFLLDVDMIVYGLWLKIFVGVNLFSVLAINVFIHKITELYHSNDFERTVKYLSCSFSLSLSISLVSLSIFSIWENEILQRWISDSKYTEGFPLAALWVWCVVNCIQSTCGVFLLSIGGNFVFLRKLALTTSGVMLLSVLYCSYHGFALYEILLYASLVYAVGCIGYCVRLLMVFKRGGIYSEVS